MSFCQLFFNVFLVGCGTNCTGSKISTDGLTFGTSYDLIVNIEAHTMHLVQSALMILPVYCVWFPPRGRVCCSMASGDTAMIRLAISLMVTGVFRF